MRAVVLFAFAGFAIAPLAGASAQQPPGGSLIDCGNPQNALTAYCNNRDAAAPVVVVPAPGVVVQTDVPTTGSVITNGQPSNGSVIDCGNPQNALTAYCSNRDQFRR